MKKFFKIFILSLVSVLVLCGCKDSSVSENTNDENEVIKNEDINNNSKDENKATNEVNKLYTISSKEIEPEIIIGDNYFATQLADIVVNFDSYKEKIIEIEGFSLKNDYGYTFVGRYSENAICPDCPTGYAYLEYEWHGDEKLDLGTEETWIKIKGELKSGNDGVYDYNYIDAYSIEVMDEWGVATVQN